MWKRKPKKISGLNGIRTHDLCDTGWSVHYTGIAEVTGSNPAQAWIVFKRSLRWSFTYLLYKVSSTKGRNKHRNACFSPTAAISQLLAPSPPPHQKKRGVGYVKYFNPSFLSKVNGQKPRILETFPDWWLAGLPWLGLHTVRITSYGNMEGWPLPASPRSVSGGLLIHWRRRWRIRGITSSGKAELPRTREW